MAILVVLLASELFRSWNELKRQKYVPKTRLQLVMRLVDAH